MGQTDSKKKIEQEFEIYKIQRDGNALLKSKKDGKQYLMRVVSCSTQADINRLKALLECRAQLKNHHILSLVQIKEKQQDMICSISYKMYLVLQYSFKNLAQEVKERSSSSEPNYFQESDVWSILYSCCTALNALYSNGATHESLTAEQIFINKDGFVKITQPLLFGLQKNHLQAMKTKDESNVVDIHLSPQIIGCLDDQNFFYYDKQKSDIFIIAMIVIDIALLSNHYLYDCSKKKPIVQEIQDLLNKVGEKYSNNLVNILGEMLRMESRLRPNLTQIIEKIQKCNSVGQDFTVQTQSNMKSHQFLQRQQQKNQLQKTNKYRETQLKQDFPFQEKRKVGQVHTHIHTNISAQDQSLSIKEPTNILNNQNFEGKVFVTTPSASHFTTRQITYPSNYQANQNNIVVQQQQQHFQQNHHFINTQHMHQTQQNQHVQQLQQQSQQTQQVQQNIFPVNYQQSPPNIRPQTINYQSIPLLKSEPVIYIPAQQLNQQPKYQPTNMMRAQQINYQPATTVIKTQQVNYQPTIIKPQQIPYHNANFMKNEQKSTLNAMIPNQNTQNFNIYQRSRSIDSIKVNSNNEFDQIKGFTAAKPTYNVQVKKNQFQAAIKSRKQPIFTHQIPQVYNIIMSSKNSGIKVDAYNKKDTVVDVEYVHHYHNQPQQHQQQQQEFVKNNKFSNLKNYNNQAVSRTGQEPQSPSFQTIQLKKNISHTQSQRQSPVKKQPQQIKAENYTQKTNYNNVYTGPGSGSYKPNPFSASTPNNYGFSSSAAGAYNESNSPIISSSFIPSMPLSPKKGQSFTCRSGFSHLALFHKQDEQLKLDFVKEQIPQRGRYQGYKHNDEKNGHGVLYFKDGGYYQGQWKHDKMHGFGKLYYQNSTIAYEGHWQNDQFNGQGRVYNSQPTPFEQEFNYKDFSQLGNRWTYYEGQFKNDSKHGKGYIKLTNGEMYQGIFDNDMIEGNGIFYKRTGEIIIGFWIDNKLFLNQSYEHQKK